MIRLDATPGNSNKFKDRNIKLHIIKLDDTEKKILKLKDNFKDLFYNNTGKQLAVIFNLRQGANIIQQNGSQIPIHSEDLVAKVLKRKFNI